VVTSDLEVRPAAAGPVDTGAPRTAAATLARAAQRSGVCLLAAFAVVGVAALSHSDQLAALAVFSMVAAVIAASGLLGYGAVDAWQAHRSQRPLPPTHNGRRPGGGRPGRTGQAIC
jgi:hypothetical protein